MKKVFRNKWFLIFGLVILISFFVFLFAKQFNKQSLEKLIYFHPLFVSLFNFLCGLIVTFVLSVWASNKVFKNLIISTKPILSWIISFIWYILSFLYFFLFFLVFPKLFFEFINIDESLLQRMSFAFKDIYFFTFSSLFFLAGIIFLFFLFKREKTDIASKPQISLLHSLWLGIKKPFVIAVSLFVLFMIFRIPVLSRQENIHQQIQKIRSSKITLDDVMGKNLPPKPDPKLNNSTLQGIDANKNGIRDDVELAIFEKYPHSPRIRAALLQYAKALQMMMKIAEKDFFDTKISDAIIGEVSRAGDCIADSLVPRKTPESSRDFADIEKINSYINFIEKKQFNTKERKLVEKKIYEYMGSYANLPNKTSCDIKPSFFQNNSMVY